jgi:hypothetical protein
MKHPVPSRRKTIQLSEPTRYQLNLYALAAGAAGAGLLAAPQTTQAKIVYTPTHVRLTNGQIPIDLNNDGIVDFIVSNKSAGGSCCLYARTLNVAGGYVGSSQNGVIGVGLNANAITPGLAIGPRQEFLYAHLRMAQAFNDSNSFLTVNGAFANTTNRYLGLAFRLTNGQIHYGWARFSVVKAGFTSGNKPVITAVLTGYAYETVTGQAIIAGQMHGPSAELTPPADLSPAEQPASLGMLALGAPALDVWRRETITQ